MLLNIKWLETWVVWTKNKRAEVFLFTCFVWSKNDLLVVEKLRQISRKMTKTSQVCFIEPFYCCRYIVFAVVIDAIEALVVKHFSPKFHSDVMAQAAMCDGLTVKICRVQWNQRLPLEKLVQTIAACFRCVCSVYSVKWKSYSSEDKSETTSRIKQRWHFLNHAWLGFS